MYHAKTPTIIDGHNHSSPNPATTPTTRPHATSRPPPTPLRVGTAHPCLGSAWTTRVRSMAAFMATQTEHSPNQTRRATRRHPAQPVTMRAKSGGSTPTRGSDHAYGAPIPPQASAGASGGGGGALVPGTVFSFSAHRRQSQAPFFDLAWLLNLPLPQHHFAYHGRFEANFKTSIGESGTVPRRFEHPSLANGKMDPTPGSNGADESALCGTACPERRVPNAAPADRRPWCESQQGRRASARRVSRGHGPPWTVPNHGCRRTVRSSARGGSRSAPRRASVTANLPWQILGAKGCHYRKKTFLLDNDMW